MPLVADMQAQALAAGKALEWMEPPHDARALGWAQGATAASTASLQNLASYPQLLAELVQANESGAQGAAIGIAGNRAVRLRKSVDHPKGLLEVAAWNGSSLGAWRTVLDVGALNAREGVDFHLQWDVKCCLASNPARCLLDLHEAGGDEFELREFDLDAGEFVAGGFAAPRSRGMATWFDADTLLIAHGLGDAPKTMTGWPARALLWRRGQPLADARPIFELEAQHALMILMPTGSDGRAVIAQAFDYSSFALHSVTRDEVRRLPLPETLKMTFGANDRHAFAVLSAPAVLGGREMPAETVVAVPLAAVDGEPRSVFSPRDGEAVNAFFSLPVTRHSVVLAVRSGSGLRIDVATTDGDGWTTRPVLQARAGITARVEGAGVGAEGFVITSEGFLTPPIQQWIDAHGTMITLDEQPAAFDASAFKVESLQARSADGQAVDFLLLGPARRPHAPVPTLMTGYGAFGITLDPAYCSSAHGASFGGVSLKLWLQRGGALAVPALRGGGEHGAAWHAAAQRENRQRSYDDFHAVAAALIDSGYTVAARLGVFGLSNGGLLAGVAGTQRPDLYGAIVSDVPLADMLRFPHMGMGGAWIDEYGDPAVPAAADWLRAYSPVHNVRPGTRYPAFLVTVATTDNRVGPGHARKLAKRLMDTGQKAFFLEPEGGGHGVSDALQQPEVLAMRTAFFVELLMALPAHA